MIKIIKLGFNLGFNKYNIQYTVNDFFFFGHVRNICLLLL